MRIEHLSTTPIMVLPYVAADGRGGHAARWLPILEATSTDLPSGLTSLVLTGDLQGRGERAQPLGTDLARVLLEERVAWPTTTGVILAGDLYSDPRAQKLGASGDVADVWVAFADRFRWVAGVLGNHDRIGVRPEDRLRFNREQQVHVLDGEQVELDGLTVGGVSGVVGKPERLLRRDMATFLTEAARVAEGADVLVLHETPAGEEGQRGNAELRAMLEAHGPPLTVCGHCYWPEPLAQLSDGRQVLNVDGRAVVVRGPDDPLAGSSR